LAAAIICAAGPFFAVSSIAHVPQDNGVRQGANGTFGAALGGGEFESLGKQNSPGGDRCQNQSAHDTFDDDVSCHEHAERRKIMRQDRIG
jgi:hypothetical protein